MFVACAQVEYSCLDGHKLEGDPVLQCDRSGQWNGPSPKCRYVDCGKLPELDGGRVVYLNKTTHLDSHVRYKNDHPSRIMSPKKSYEQAMSFFIYLKDHPSRVFSPK